MKILVISTEEYLTLRLLKCLAGSDAVIHVMGAGSGPAIRASRHCRRYQAFDRSDLARSDGPMSADIEIYCRRHAIDVILPSGMASGFFLAAAKKNLSTPTLPLPPVDLLRTFDNKWLFSRLLQQHGLPFPESRLIESAESTQALDLEFPVIIKPLDLDASRGVTRCDSQDEVTAHLRRSKGGLPLLAQEYIPGADVGLGLLAREGTVLAFSIQRQCPDGRGVDFIPHGGILEIGRQIMSACRYEGIAHFDLRLDSRDGSIKVLECNPRFWASLPFCMLAGVNFADLGIRLALNQPLPETACRPVSITFPTKALSEAMRGKDSSRRFSPESRQALRFTLSDPIPNLILGAGKMGRKMNNLFWKNPREVYE